jgi:hypothetical protein
MRKNRKVSITNRIIFVAACCAASANVLVMPAPANDFKHFSQQLIADQSEKKSSTSYDEGAPAADAEGDRPAESKEHLDDNGDRSAVSTGEEREPHTLLYYVINAIATTIGITMVLAIISSSTVTFCACIWHILKLKNGGKKPSIG